MYFMTPEIQLLSQAVSEEPLNRSVYRWDDLLAAIETVAGSDSLGWEAESVLLRVLRFEGELELSDDSEHPHSMSPEEMLKSVAIQTLAKRTGLTHLLEMQRIEATAASPVLASIVRATILAATPLKLPAKMVCAEFCTFSVTLPVTLLAVLEKAMLFDPPMIALPPNATGLLNVIAAVD